MTEYFSEIDLRKIDLNLLLVFSALMRERSVGKAATRLFIGPSAISMALARLRNTLGDDLFVRAGSGMAPTPYAETLWAEIAPALSQIDAAVRRSAFDPLTTEITFRFGAPDDLEFVLVPRLIERLGEAAPGATLVVSPSDFRTLFGRLDGGSVDVALSALPEHGGERRHRVKRLHRDGFSVLYDAERLGQSGPVSMARFVGTPHVLLSIRGDLRGPVDEALAREGRERKVVATVAHFPTVPFILKRRAVMACIPSIAAKFYADAFGLERCPLPIASPEFSVGLAWHVRIDRDPAQIWFRGLVEDIVAGLAKEARASD